MQPFPSSGIIISDLSDHFPIFTRVNLQYNSYNHEVKYIRKNNPSNIAKFREEPIAADWTNILHEQDVNTSFNCFVNRFMLLYNQNVPLVKHNTRDRKKTPRMPWISTSLLKSINKKNKLYYSYKVSGTDSSRKRYVNYRNILLQCCVLQRKHTFSLSFKQLILSFWCFFLSLY